MNEYIAIGIVLILFACVVYIAIDALKKTKSIKVK